MLICITIAYNFSPFYFQQLAQQLIANSASAVNEPSLPLAFYGLSYLPLLIAFTGLGNWVKNTLSFGEVFFYW